MIALLCLILFPTACGDGEPPLFIETVIAKDTNDYLGSYAVTSVVKDNRLVSWVRITYRYGLSAGSVTADLKHDEGPDVWTAYLKGPLRTTRVYYSLEAGDEDGNIARDPALAPDTYSFRIKPDPPPYFPRADAAVTDSTTWDAALSDAVTGDANTPEDASPADAGVVDTGVMDIGALDTGLVDNPAFDLTPPDVRSNDAGGVDTATPDIAVVDSARPDTRIIADSGLVDSAPPPNPVLAIAAGHHHTCALLSDGRLKCWGWNEFGRLGLGDTERRGDAPNEMGSALPAVDVGAGRSVSQFAAGGWHTCAVLDNSSVKCWGYNGFGQLGLGHNMDMGDGPFEMGDSLAAVNLGTNTGALLVTAGNYHSCAVLQNNQIKCWGENQTGKLGLGDTVARGSLPEDMGANLPQVDLGDNRSASAVLASSDHTCAILDNADFKCWGKNNSGQLGLGNTVYLGNDPGEMGNALVPVALGSGRSVQFAASIGGHNCVVLDNGSVKCWGLNFRGELGLGDTDNRGDNTGEMGDSLLPVDLGTTDPVTAVASGFFHNCALFSNGKVKCWGGNDSGQLGLGHTNTMGDQPDELGTLLPYVELGSGRHATSITAGAYHSCALLDNATVKCWGYNSNGELGQGDQISRGAQPNQMGDNLPAIALD